MGIRVFSGKRDLLRNLPSRLRGYAAYPSSHDLRILILVDRDSDDCLVLKERLEQMSKDAGLPTRSRSDDGRFVVCNRIAVEELEAWFLGDPAAVTAAYPRVPPTFANKAKFRVPDAVSGGTWESLHHLLMRHRYHQAGLAKVQLAKDISQHMDPEVNTSRSFCAFRDGVRSLVVS